MGFNLENCEVWFERAVIGVMTMTAVVIVVRVSHPFSPCATKFLSAFLADFRLASDAFLVRSGSFRDLHLQLLLPPLSLSVVVVIVLLVNIYGAAAHEF